ncbi:MAG: response regulator [Bdellovibrionota bacterium]
MLETELKITNQEKTNATILIVEQDAAERNNLKHALQTIGFFNISDSPNHLASLEKIEQRHFTHVFFNIKETNMPIEAFMKKLLELENNVIAIACSSEPEIDRVFDMLINGARGFLVKPFTIEGVDNSITTATKGEPINSFVLQANDRNEALAAIMMASTDNMASILRQSKQFETAKYEIPKYLANLNSAVNLAHTFVKGSDEELLNVLTRLCIERSKGPSTRLGRLRKKLQYDR